MISKNDSRNAGFFRRVAATFYDLFLIAALLLLGTLMLLPITNGRAIAPNNHFYQSYLLSLVACFYLGFWLYNGQTLGMLAWHLRIVTIEGYRLTFFQGLKRLVFFTMNLAFFGLGFFWMLIDKQRNTLYDRWSQTKVVRD